MTKLEQQNLAVQVPFKSRYQNFIGGKWVSPVNGRYFENVTPITGRPFCEIPRSRRRRHRSRARCRARGEGAWGRTSPAERANILNRIADRMEQNLDLLAHAETWDNGKPMRETRPPTCRSRSITSAISPAAFARRKASLGEIDHDTVAYHFHEPLGVVGQIIPWNFPMLMAAWKLAPALAAGNCVVLKPAEQTPVGILVWAELIGDLLPPGVLNIVNGFGLEAGKPLAIEPAHREDRVHRRDDDRSPHHAVRSAEPDSGDARARRQVAEHLLRRRDAPRTTTSSTRRSKAS